MLSTTTTFPNKFFIILEYGFSYFTKLLAISINPFSFFNIFKVSLSINFSFIIFKGKNVTLPKLLFFKYVIASLAHTSLSTTTLDEFAPSVIEIALEYFSSTFFRRE